MTKTVQPARYAHRSCTFILPAGIRPARYPPGTLYHPPRTHGCWCLAWRLTRNGLRVWRRGAWRKPRPGELRRVKGAALERWKLMGYG